MKTISPEIVRKRVLRTGDGSHHYSVEHTHQQLSKDQETEHEEHVWGWQDDQMTEEEKSDVTIVNQSAA
jgi:stearoyl-CoA desaturase (delta-9 desaturase)